MEIMSVKEVSELLKVSRQTINTLISNGKLPAYKIGRVYRIKKEDLLEYLKNSRTTKQ